jgi:hypothetical protein
MVVGAWLSGAANVVAVDTLAAEAEAEALPLISLLWLATSSNRPAAQAEEDQGPSGGRG